MALSNKRSSGLTQAQALANLPGELPRVLHRLLHIGGGVPRNVGLGGGIHAGSVYPTDFGRRSGINPDVRCFIVLYLTLVGLRAEMQGLMWQLLASLLCL